MTNNKYLQSQKTNKHDQHELPELYLKGFSEHINGVSSVWIFDRERPFSQDRKNPPTNPFPISTAKATVTKDRFAIVNEDGSVDSNTYEDALQVQETKRDSIFSKIRRQEPITKAEKGSFAGYIQMMMKRTTRREKRFEKIQDTYWKDRAREFNQQALQYALSGHFTAARRLYSLNRFIEIDVLRDRVFRASMLTEYKELHKRLTELTWLFYVAPSGSYFVTSDDPVVLLGKIGELPIVFPLSNEIAIIIANSIRPDLAYTQMTADQIRVINFLIIIHAEQIISPKPDKWIFDIWENGIRLSQDQSTFLNGMLGS
jgi:hypothetical protein